MSRFIDVLLNSKELKKELVKRSFELQIPFKFICKEAGVDYKMFMKTYINSSSGDPEYITEEQFIKVMGMLGMKVQHLFVIDKNFDHESIWKKFNDDTSNRKDTDQTEERPKIFA